MRERRGSGSDEGWVKVELELELECGRIAGWCGEGGDRVRIGSGPLLLVLVSCRSGMG